MYPKFYLPQKISSFFRLWFFKFAFTHYFLKLWRCTFPYTIMKFIFRYDVFLDIPGDRFRTLFYLFSKLAWNVLIVYMFQYIAELKHFLWTMLNLRLIFLGFLFLFLYMWGELFNIVTFRILSRRQLYKGRTKVFIKKHTNYFK